MTLRGEQVTLREITSETVRAVIDLAVAESQHVFIAPNAVSLAEALFSSDAWYRAIYDADEIAGFVMQFNLVVSKNQSAIRLWQQLGFTIVGTLPGAFRHADRGFVDAFVMHRSLIDR